MPERPRLPRVSVVVPSLDQASWLDLALRSLLDQRYPDLEILVADGGSRDGSVDVIRRHAGRLAWWVSEPDAGQVDAIEKGLSRATGEVVGWLNADDLLLPGALDAIGRAFLDPAVEATCGWSLVIDEEGRRVGTQVYPQPTREVLLARPRLPQETVHWRRSLGARLGPLDRGLSLSFDREWWLRMAAAGVVPRLLRRFLAAWRVHPGQKGRRLAAESDREDDEILRRVHGPEATAGSQRRRVPRGWRWRRSILRRAVSLGLVRVPSLPPTLTGRAPPVASPSP